MTTEEMKNWIDKASYEQLLERWRFAPVGAPLFRGEIGSYYRKVIAKRRDETDNAVCVQASKNIGWEK